MACGRRPSSSNRPHPSPIHPAPQPIHSAPAVGAQPVPQHRYPSPSRVTCDGRAVVNGYLHATDRRFAVLTPSGVEEASGHSDVMQTGGPPCPSRGVLCQPRGRGTRRQLCLSGRSWFLVCLCRGEFLLPAAGRACGASMRSHDVPAGRAMGGDTRRVPDSRESNGILPGSGWPRRATRPGEGAFVER